MTGYLAPAQNDKRDSHRGVGVCVEGEGERRGGGGGGADGVYDVRVCSCTSTRVQLIEMGQCQRTDPYSWTDQLENPTPVPSEGRFQASPKQSSPNLVVVVWGGVGVGVGVVGVVGVWCGVVWCGVVWCGVVWCGAVCVCVVGGSVVVACLLCVVFFDVD